MMQQIYKPIINSFGDVRELNVFITDPTDTTELLEKIDHLLLETGDNPIEISGMDDPEARDILFHVDGELFMTLEWQGEDYIGYKNEE